MGALLEVVALVVGVPVALLLLMLVLARVEAAMLQPHERAVALTDLLVSAHDPDRVEAEATRLLSPFAPRGKANPKTRQA